ncbi:hypothetical protein TWF481_001204 [Arthrobotrys musiformis]|uniref:Uncharacterized protein n=1 Tax=Arthrobotrys musiformis TaxID=47236 RepID=A0AAV9WPZ8_9PEZI
MTKPIRPIMMDYVPSAQYAREDINSTNYDLSDLCIKHIKTHLKSAELYRAKLAELLTNSQKPGAIPPLTTIAMNSMINSLREDPSPSNFETVIKHCPESLLGAMIDSPKLHYTSMLRFSEQKGWDKLKDDSKRDIWILKNEYFVRADGTDWGLLNLEDSDIVFGQCSKLVENEAGEPIYREITRKIAPTSGLQYLDQKRPRTIKIQPSTAAFKKTFDRLMGGALDGLDWNNILVAGGMSLSTLLCVDESMDEQFKSNDIDMYIYGLTPAEANEKIKHVANIWTKNLEPDQYTIVKNARTVTLIGMFPRRRVQIIMKMIKNPATVLLNFDLDQVAIGYTGDSVLFLPRCARALETGYTIFTLDMIHGHHLNERRETQESRLLKYAQRGFGVRILPEFCQMVELDFSKRRVTHPFIDQAVGDISGARNHWFRHEVPQTLDVLSGIQAVRRVFAAGEDMVHRFYIGLTEVSAPEDYDDQEDFYGDPEDGNRYGHSDYYLFDWKDPETGEKKRLPKGQFSSIDTYRSGVGAPHGKRGLGSLEMHARHCALFRFESEKKMIVDYNTLASTTYDVESYDMLPQYEWNSQFKPEKFTDAIDSYNENLFQKFCSVLEDNPAIESSVLGPGRGNYNRAFDRGWQSHLKGYLTRRIRRIAYSTNINELVDRFQIVIPVVVTFKLEEWIKETFAQAVEDAGLPANKHEILIPVHKPGMGDGRLPDLTESEEENVRYWVIDSTTIWAGLDRRIDEIFEILWVIALSSDLVSEPCLGYSSRADAAKDWYKLVASILLRRVTKLSIQQLGITRVGRSADMVPDDDDYGGEEELTREFVEPKVPEDINPLEIPNERDQYLFTKWLMERPIEIYRSYQYEVHNSYRESNNAIPPPEIMYLREGADYTGAEWTEWPEGSPGFSPVATFRPQQRKKFGTSDAEAEEDAEGEPAPAEDPVEGEEAPRGTKRQRESVDITEMLRPSGAGAGFASFGNDTKMADADDHGEGEGAGPSSAA